MEGKKGAAYHQKNQINLLPDIGEKKSFLDRIKDENHSLIDLPQNLKSSLIKHYRTKSAQASEIVNSFKKVRLRNIEVLLRIDKSQMLFSNKKICLYNSESGKLVIIELDLWGDPSIVTVKENTKVTLRCVKFLDDQPFLFPIYNEKNIPGRIMHIDTNEIWYEDTNVVSVVSFHADKWDIIKIKTADIKHLDKKSMFHYIKNYSTVYKNNKLHEIIMENSLDIEDIIKVREGYVIGKTTNDSYKALIFDEDNNLFDEICMKSLPALDDAAFDILFSKDISEYIKANNYPFEDFRQNGDHIELWRTIGKRQVCVMRYRI